MSSLTNWTPDGSQRKDVCPVLDDPEPDRYCMLLSSLDVPRPVQFCLRDFRDSPIYKKWGSRNPELRIRPETKPVNKA